MSKKLNHNSKSVIYGFGLLSLNGTFSDVTQEKGLTDDEISAVQTMLMVVSVRRVCSQFKEFKQRTDKNRKENNG